MGCWEGPSFVLGSGQAPLPAPPHPSIPLNPKTSTWAKGRPALETPSTISLLGEELLTGVTSRGCPSQTHYLPEQWSEPLWGWEARRSRVLLPFPSAPFFLGGDMRGEEGHSLAEKDTLSPNAREENAPATEDNRGDQAPEMRGEVAWVTQGQPRA